MTFWRKRKKGKKISESNDFDNSNICGCRWRHTSTHMNVGDVISRHKRTLVHSIWHLFQKICLTGLFEFAYLKNFNFSSNCQSQFVYFRQNIWSISGYFFFQSTKEAKIKKFKTKTIWSIFSLFAVCFICFSCFRWFRLLRELLCLDVIHICLDV